MNVDTISAEKKSPDSRLTALESQYERAGQKIWWWLSVPLLWVSSWFVVDWVDVEWAWDFFGLWCILVLILIGMFIYKRFPAKENVIHEYSQLVLPKIFSGFGVRDVKVARRHDLSMKTFLESGLYHDKYNSISREDSVQGILNGEQFGMYEVAMQVGSSRMGGRAGIVSTTRTNHFYGWFIVLNAARIPGFHFITMRARKNSGESDDWHVKTFQHWDTDTQLQKIILGNPVFDQQFLLNSDHPHALISLLSPTMQEFLLYLAHTTKNSFAISIQKSRIYVMIGHENASLRKCPDQNFAGEYPPDLVEDVKWFVELIQGLSRMRLN